MKKARKYTGWLLRSFFSRRPEVIISLYQTYVIPRLEYGSILWSPYKISDIEKIEAVQRTITSKVDRMINLNYHKSVVWGWAPLRKTDYYFFISMNPSHTVT